MSFIYIFVEGLEIYTVDLYRKVRLARVGGKSQRECASMFGISRETVRKMDSHSVPPGYQRRKPVVQPKLGPFTPIIDGWLEADKSVHRKQRHTAKRVFDRLRDEHSFNGGYTIVKDYIRKREQRTREMFVPLAHAPGHAQADFGEADVIIAGQQRRIYFFCLDLPHSDACFVKAYEAATAEAWMEGHVSAFAFFGGLPISILYDNDKCLVSKIQRDGTRVRAQLFSACQSHYLFMDKYGRPGKGNDKGNVEGLVGYARRNFMVPVPRFDTLVAFNAYLEDCCLGRQSQVLRGQTQSIGERLLRDLDAFTSLPAVPFEACAQASGMVSSQALVRYKNNDYSVPVAYGHRQVWIRAYVDKVLIGSGADVIAKHTRSYERGDTCFDPVHYLPLLERKLAAFDQAAPLIGWNLPDHFALFRDQIERRLGKAGKREYIQVLRLMETFEVGDVASALKRALSLGTIGYDAVKHLTLCQVEQRPPKLDLDAYPYLPRAVVGMTKAADYTSLMASKVIGNGPSVAQLEVTS